MLILLQGSTVRVLLCRAVRGDAEMLHFTIGANENSDNIMQYDRNCFSKIK